jgi:hypothetical protein
VALEVAGSIPVAHPSIRSSPVASCGGAFLLRGCACRRFRARAPTPPRRPMAGFREARNAWRARGLPLIQTPPVIPPEGARRAIRPSFSGQLRSARPLRCPVALMRVELVTWSFSSGLSALERTCSHRDAIPICMKDSEFGSDTPLYPVCLRTSAQTFCRCAHIGSAGAISLPLTYSLRSIT